MTIGLTKGSHTEVNINIPPSTLGLRVNATPKAERECIAFSEFNLTSPGIVPLVIQVIPNYPTKLVAFVRRDVVPSSTDYDWLLTSGDNYTTYITADETKDATHMYIGVQSSKSSLILLYTILLILVFNAVL